MSHSHLLHNYLLTQFILSRSHNMTHDKRPKVSPGRSEVGLHGDLGHLGTQELGEVLHPLETGLLQAGHAPPHHHPPVLARAHALSCVMLWRQSAAAACRAQPVSCVLARSFVMCSYSQQQLSQL